MSTGALFNGMVLSIAAIDFHSAITLSDSTAIRPIFRRISNFVFVARGRGQSASYVSAGRRARITGALMFRSARGNGGKEDEARSARCTVYDRAGR